MPEGVPPLVIEDSHTYHQRGARRQVSEHGFLDNKSRKPYEAHLKPLLGWWKSFRRRRLTESKTLVDARCALDSEHAVFSQ